MKNYRETYRADGYTANYGRSSVSVTYTATGGTYTATRADGSTLSGVVVWAATRADVIRTAADAAGWNAYTIETGCNWCPVLGANSITAARVIADRYPGARIMCREWTTGAEYAID